jgi:hypothetical protein
LGHGNAGASGIAAKAGVVSEWLKMVRRGERDRTRRSESKNSV